MHSEVLQLVYNWIWCPVSTIAYSHTVSDSPPFQVPIHSHVALTEWFVEHCLDIVVLKQLMSHAVLQKLPHLHELLFPAPAHGPEKQEKIVLLQVVVVETAYIILSGHTYNWGDTSRRGLRAVSNRGRFRGDSWVVVAFSCWRSFWNRIKYLTVYFKDSITASASCAETDTNPRSEAVRRIWTSLSSLVFWTSSTSTLRSRSTSCCSDYITESSQTYFDSFTAISHGLNPIFVAIT